MKNKILLFVILNLFILCLTSCAKLNIPDGDIKDFVVNFDADVAFKNVNFGTTKLTNIYYDSNDIEIGKFTSYAVFDKRDNSYYYYLDSTASGNFNDELSYDYQAQKVLCYASEEDKTNVYSCQITDGVKEELFFSYDQVIIAVQNCFYKDLTAGFHSGGIYYGDYVLKNVKKYYNNFKLNEEKTELTYEINISTPTEKGNEILNCHKFVINNYGMLLSVETKAYHIENEKVTATLITTMECDYVTEITKILSI